MTRTRPKMCFLVCPQSLEGSNPEVTRSSRCAQASSTEDSAPGDRQAPVVVLPWHGREEKRLTMCRRCAVRRITAAP
ncbi:hypothetical protein NDU88_002607 [Pleurodeles waltl]|uniref:Uncharacterized protein n=1 Tax=Pleurodeles waltl TaxID=8319 RepID=A0AAV7M4E9_PLEWA|nr:hypothetical protein NDU88_002607 [Pleurodeles waltl]